MTVIIFDEYVKVNGIYMATPAWRPVDPALSDLQQMAPNRGEDIVVPHAPGRLGTDRTPDELICQIPMQIRGARNQNNTPYADPRQGLYTNWEYLKANTGAALPSVPGSGIKRPIVFHQFNGTELEGDAYVEWIGFVKKTDRIAHSTLRLTFAAGELS